MAYIRFIGNESEAHLIHGKSNLDNTALKHYIKIKAEYSPTLKDSPWGINTPYSDITIDIDKGLQKLLVDYMELTSIINKYRGPGSGAYLVVVMQYDEDEEKHGIYLSCDTISLLAESKLDFETDIVSVLD